MKKSLLIASTLFISSSAFAECEGTVDSYKVDSSGLLSATGGFVDGGSAVSADICNITIARNGVSPEICKVFLSTIMTAEATDRPIATSIDNGKSCHYYSYEYGQLKYVTLK